MSEWNDDPKEVLDLAEMDELVTAYKTARMAYNEAKEASNIKHREYKEEEAKCIKALEAAGKKSYKVDGVGNFSVISKQTVTVPKTIEDKDKLFLWIEENYDNDFLTSMLSIHHGKLNSFYNEAYAECEDKALFELPGLEPPTFNTEARFKGE